MSAVEPIFLTNTSSHPVKPILKRVFFHPCHAGPPKDIFVQAVTNYKDHLAYHAVF